MHGVNARTTQCNWIATTLAKPHLEAGIVSTQVRCKCRQCGHEKKKRMYAFFLLFAHFKGPFLTEKNRSPQSVT